MFPELKRQEAPDIFSLLGAAADTFGDKIFLRYEENHEVLEKSYKKTFEDSMKAARWTAG